MLNHAFWNAFWFYGAAFFAIILVRYFLVAGGMYLFFYRRSLPVDASQKAPHIPSQDSIQKDIQLSIISASIFAIAAALIISAYNYQLTSIYNDPNHYGLWYLGFSYVLVLVLQDTYFYFTHRLFHHPSLFHWLHQGHHRSLHPTPWTSFAFDPLEAIVSCFFLIVIVLIIPLHFITLIAVLTTMTVWAVLNHLGIDRLPRKFPHHWLGKWFIGPDHHSIHHLRYTFHYGLYFTFWDYLLHTQDPNYNSKVVEKLAINNES